MSWRVTKISGAVTTGSWRVAKVSGSVSSTPLSSWRIAKISGSVVAGAWRLLKISGSVAAPSTAPTLAPIATQTVDPAQLVTITAVVTNGLVPDSYSFTSPGIAITVSGNTGTFLSPATPTGGTVTVTVTATKGAFTSSAQTASVIVAAALGGYRAADTTIHGISNPYLA